MLQSNSHLKFADFLISSAELESFFAYSEFKKAISPQAAPLCINLLNGKSVLLPLFKWLV